MRVRSIIATAVVSVLQVVAGLLLIMFSVHGPAGLAIAGFAYIVVGLGLTVWVATRRDTFPAFLGVALLPVVAVPGLIETLERIERFRSDRRIAATRVSDVRDEPILSTLTGKPIGVRVTFNVSVPSRGYFGISPWLYSRDPKTERLSLSPMRQTIDGSLDSKPFEAGKTHAMVVELYPPSMFFKRDERCFATSWLVDLPDSTVAQPLRISISESMYGETWRGGKEEVTTGSYDLAELYRGVIAEGLKPCTATPSP